jgi:excisionase family DNA binding protein
MSKSRKGAVAPEHTPLPVWLADIEKDLRPVMSIKEAADVSHISTRTLRRHIAAGRLTQLKTGDGQVSRVLIPRGALIELLQSLALAGAA